MKNFIITGTSGVGKSFLEEVLNDKYGFMPLRKYTDREARPGEDQSKTKSITKEEFDNAEKNKEFIFRLDYAGFRYGWKKADAETNSDKHLTLGVTLESMRYYYDYLPDYVAILLTIDPDNMNLLIDRMKKRENYDNLNSEQKLVIDKKIQDRVDLAKKELENIDEYVKIIESHGGKTFYIKDDRTLFDEVIPWILSKIRHE